MTKPTGDAVDALSFVCHKQKAESMGRRVALKLKEVIDRQNFEINIQVRLDACMHVCADTCCGLTLACEVIWHL